MVTTSVYAGIKYFFNGPQTISWGDVSSNNNMNMSIRKTIKKNKLKDLKVLTLSCNNKNNIWS